MHKTQRKRLVLNSETIRVVALPRGLIRGGGQDTRMGIAGETPESQAICTSPGNQDA